MSTYPTTPDSGPNGYTGTALYLPNLPTQAASPFAGFGNAHTFDGVNRADLSMMWVCGPGPNISGSFCLEAKVRTGAIVSAGYYAIAGRRGASGGGFLLLRDGTSNKFRALAVNAAGADVGINGTTTVAANTNYTVAMTYDCTTLRLFVNGTLEASTAMTGTQATTVFPAVPFTIGADRESNPIPWLGTIDEVRLSSVSRYTATYTIASAPFTSDASTVGLWHLDTITDFTTPDSGPNGYHGVAPGIPAPIPSPHGSAFGNAHNWPGDYHDMASAGWDCGTGPQATGPFTIEAKIRTSTSVGGIYSIAGKRGQQQNVWLYVSNGQLTINVNNSSNTEVGMSSGGATIAPNTKYDAAATYDGTTLRLFLDGVLKSSTALAGLFTPDLYTPFQIGHCTDQGSGGYTWAGAIEEVRLSSVARYTAGYTPATSPFASDSDTVGLWHLDSIGSATVYSVARNYKPLYPSLTQTDSPPAGMYDLVEGPGPNYSCSAQLTGNTGLGAAAKTYQLQPNGTSMTGVVVGGVGQANGKGWWIPPTTGMGSASSDLRFIKAVGTTLTSYMYLFSCNSTAGCTIHLDTSYFKRSAAGALTLIGTAGNGGVVPVAASNAAIGNIGMGVGLGADVIFAAGETLYIEQYVTIPGALTVANTCNIVVNAQDPGINQTVVVGPQGIGYQRSRSQSAASTMTAVAAKKSALAAKQATLTVAAARQIRTGIFKTATLTANATALKNLIFGPKQAPITVTANRQSNVALIPKQASAVVTATKQIRVGVFKSATASMNAAAATYAARFRAFAATATMTANNNLRLTQNPKQAVVTVTAARQSNVSVFKAASATVTAAKQVRAYVFKTATLTTTAVYAKAITKNIAATVTASASTAKFLNLARSFSASVSATSKVILGIPQGVFNRLGDYPLSTPSLSISGVVYDEDSNAVISGATINLHRDSDNVFCQTTTSAADGSWSFLRDLSDPNTYYTVVFWTDGGGNKLHGTSDRGQVPG